MPLRLQQNPVFIALAAALSFCFGFIFLIGTDIQNIVVADTGYFSFQRDNWFALTNFTSNSFTPWRLDNGLLNILGTGSYNRIFLINFYIFISGIISVCVLHGASLIRSFLVSLISFYAVYGVFGFDLVIVASLSWVPWLFVLPAILTRSTFWGILFTTIVAARFIASANQLSLLITLALLLLVRLSKVQIIWKDFLFLLIPFFAGLRQFRTPLLSSPLYPPSSAVVPHWGSDLGVQPLIGAGVTIPSIDRTLVSSIYWPLTLTLFGALVFLLLLKRKNEGNFYYGLLITAATLCGCVLLDNSFLFPINFVQIMPLASVARVLPNLIFFSLTPIALAFSIFLFALAAGVAKNRIILILQAILIICLLTASKLSPIAVDSRANSIVRGVQVLSPEQQPVAYKVLNSPSLAVIKQFGLQWISNIDYYKSVKFRPVSLRAEISATHEPGLIKLMRDRKPKTRWTTSLGHQSGKEWVMLRLPQAREVMGVTASAEPFATDFPRGLEVRSSANCTGLVSEIDSFDTILNVPRWNGWINFSSDGYPYIEPPSRVNVIFPKPVQAQCILIKQTGQDQNFDWSISELRIADHEENPTDIDSQDELN